MPAQPVNRRKNFPLRAVTRRIKQMLLDAESRQFWVRANFICDNAQRSPSGHLYGTLVEHDAKGNVVAKMRATIWQSDREVIDAKLAKVDSNDILSGHREICARCAVQFHSVHGLSLTISDIDPEAAESQLERNRRLVLEKLQAEGLLEANGSLSLPLAPIKIGLITGPGSAAHADFIKTLDVSGFAFDVTIVAASMQGDGLRQSVVSAFADLQEEAIDLICLVRGGGSPTDLAGFDDEIVGRRIASCSYPVWVGIGHETDVTVPDFVAHTTFKTPTAVAAELVKRVQVQWDLLEVAAQKVKDACGDRLAMATKDLSVMENGLRQGTRKHLQLQQERFSARESKTQDAVKGRVREAESDVRLKVTQLHERTVRALTREAERLTAASDNVDRSTSNRLEHVEKALKRRTEELQKLPRLIDRGRSRLQDKDRLLAALRPERMLERGYSIVRDKSGNLVRDASSVKTGDQIEIQLAKGRLISDVVDSKSGRDE